MLDQDGNFYTANLRTAQPTDSTRSRAAATETFEPHFTFHGFRYVKVEGFPGTPTLDAITGIVVHSAMPRTGEFASSDPMVNQLDHNIVWGQQGNFVGVPTDCPQRDERLGWTGDAQVFSRTAAFNFDVAGFFTKWLRDLAVDQRANGAFPDVIPDVLSRGQKNGTSSAGWGDARSSSRGRCTSLWRHRLLERNTRACATTSSINARRPATSYVEHRLAYGDWLAFATTTPTIRGRPRTRT